MGSTSGGDTSVKETQMEKAAAEVAAQKWKYYQENFRPLEDTYMKKVDSSISDGTMNFARGSAASSTTSSFDNTRKQAAGNLRNAGINPNSGVFKSAMNDISLSEAASSSDAKARAEGTVTDNYVTGVQNVSAIGRGQSTQAQSGLYDLAAGAQQTATQNAVDQFNKTSDRLNTAGTLAGAATYMAKNGGGYSISNKNTGASANVYDDGRRVS